MSLVTVVLTRPVRLYDAEKDSALNLYYAETEGALEMERIDSYMEGEQTRIDDGIKALDEAAQQLENGTIGELEYTRQVILWESLPARAEALEEFRQDMAYLRDSGQGQEGQTVHRQGVCGESLWIPLDFGGEVQLAETGTFLPSGGRNSLHSGFDGIL